ncbi:hypothetical protein SAMN04488508_101659 [Aquimarina spongiae]|uniref:Uncharacterized protein n=2 Tax=Aquimarina spongiae TaxID=570521 RepID=A0A1M6B6V4_9FLAO|nr:hypothetical protein SAMN04488508_101659 [Aquimarina spongiae]
MVVLVLVCFMESTLIKRQYPGILGWILSAVLIIAMTMRVLRWPYATEIMVISTVLLLSVLILFAIKEKNKTILNHMLMAYVAIRVLMLLFRPIDFLWILEMIIGCSVVILGIRDSIKISKALFYTK